MSIQVHGEIVRRVKPTCDSYRFDSSKSVRCVLSYCTGIFAVFG